MTQKSGIKMKLRDTVFLALHSLMSNPLEAVLQVLATTLGVAFFASSLSLIQQYSKDIAEVATDIRFRMIRVIPQAWSLPYESDVPVRVSSQEAVLNIKFPLSLLAEVKAECPAVQYAWAEEYWGYGSRYSTSTNGAEVSEQVTTFVAVRKVAGDFFAAYDLQIQEGSIFTASDYRTGTQAIIVGFEYAKQHLWPRKGIGAAIANSYQGTVVGILKHHDDRFAVKGAGLEIDGSLITPLDLAGFTTSLCFVPKDSSLMDAAISQLQTFFVARYGESAVKVGSERSTLHQETRMAVPLLSLIVFLSGAILFVVGMNILSLLLGSVGRRTRSIGLFTAVGAARVDLFKQYVAEFSISGFTGSILGIAAAFGLNRILQGMINPQGIALPGLRLTSQPLTFVGAALLVLALNFFFAVIPAIQAIGTKPADAVRYE